MVEALTNRELWRAVAIAAAAVWGVGCVGIAVWLAWTEADEHGA